MGSVKVLSGNIRPFCIRSQLLNLGRSFVITHSPSIQSAIHRRFLGPSLTTELLFNQQKRHLLPRLPNPFGDKGRGEGKKLKYAENHLLGYSMDQMFDIVSKVELYHEFVPWCKESAVVKRNRGDSFLCKLTVGFPPVVERYTSLVTVKKPNIVKSVCSDGMLFNHLETVWKFSKGMDDRLDTCTLDFYVEFEFRSLLHSRLAQMFFDEVVRTMVNAFLKRAKVLYGPPSKVTQGRKRISYNPTDFL